MRYKILDNGDFQRDFEEKIVNAKKKIYCQFMTFEGDDSGLKISKILIDAKKRGVDVKVIIDCFTDFYVSDTYYKKREVAEEVLSTKKMIQSMKDDGIEIIRTRPYGFCNILFLFRNHKKIVIIDDFFYLGGINISDHNFEWDDFMVRIKEKKLLGKLLADYDNTCKGISKNIQFLNLLTNKYIEIKLNELLRNAKNEIIISSPYLIDISFLKKIKALNGNVAVKILTLEHNNFRFLNFLTNYIYPILIRDKRVEIHFYKKFSHSKFIIVDRKKVLFGSSNFSDGSFFFLEEIAFFTEDQDFVEEFYQKLYLNKKSLLKEYNKKISFINFCVGFFVSHSILKLIIPVKKIFGRFVDEIQ